MISQRCPKCLSKRVRHGYRPTPVWSKFLMRYNLLCDGCNWEFVGFAVPGTITHKPIRKSKIKTAEGLQPDEPGKTIEEDEKSKVYKAVS
jgi:hypothetical protein